MQWLDLLRLSRLEVAVELALSLPWLLGAWWAAAHGHLLLALGAWFMFFLTGLRQTHNAFHHALGLSRPATHGVMFILSVLMLGSMHAVQVNHLRHHSHCLGDEDVEALSARLPWWQAVLVGPLFPLRLHLKALQVGTPTQRAWIRAELAANLLALALVFLVIDLPWLKQHVAAMALGQCLTAFFAVWTVHHGCQPGAHPARTVRGRTQALLTYSMFFHAEHHMFPAVPTCKLQLLARRLDAVAPRFAARRVF